MKVLHCEGNNYENIWWEEWIRERERERERERVVNIFLADVYVQCKKSKNCLTLPLLHKAMRQRQTFTWIPETIQRASPENLMCHKKSLEVKRKITYIKVMKVCSSEFALLSRFSSATIFCFFSLTLSVKSFTPYSSYANISLSICIYKNMYHI